MMSEEEYKEWRKEQHKKLKQDFTRLKLLKPKKRQKKKRDPRTKYGSIYAVEGAFRIVKGSYGSKTGG